MVSPSFVPVIRNGGPLTASTVTATGPITSAGQLIGADFTPADHGLETWTHDPYYATSSSIVTNGTVYVVKLPLRRNVVATNLWWSVGTAGATPTAGQNEVGWYSSTGVRLISTNVDASISSSGAKRTSAAASLTDAFVWAGFVFNATLAPTLTRGSSFETTPNINLAANVRRAAVAATGATVLPASFDPATLSTSGCLTLFAALEAAA